MRAVAAAVLLAALAAPAAAEVPVAEHELGARLGLQLNAGGLGAGGVHLGGVFQEQLTDALWLELGAHLAFGGGGPTCYLARDQSTTCDPPVASGAGAQLLAGARWYLFQKERFLFSAAAGGGVALTTFRGDNLIGFGVPLYVAAGMRTRVGEGVAVGGDLQISAGASVLDRGQGLRPFVAIMLLGGVDFSL